MFKNMFLTSKTCYKKVCNPPLEGTLQTDAKNNPLSEMIDDLTIRETYFLIKRAEAAPSEVSTTT